MTDNVRPFRQKDAPPTPDEVLDNFERDGALVIAGSGNLDEIALLFSKASWMCHQLSLGSFDRHS